MYRQARGSTSAFSDVALGGDSVHKDLPGEQSLVDGRQSGRLAGGGDRLAETRAEAELRISIFKRPLGLTGQSRRRNRGEADLEDRRDGGHWNRAPGTRAL